MGLFDWLLGNRSHQPPSCPKPRVISGLDDGSLFVVVDTGNSMTTIMDRMAYEYMYGDVKKSEVMLRRKEQHDQAMHPSREVVFFTMD